ncbi:MAG: hypothetical protein B6I20_13560 [Bacteroidetes bacterium 4572_117]|nr:MAG: hypothetical protein B6I20_13560 [Bacteroidetes bacterium 4572_117]
MRTSVKLLTIFFILISNIAFSQIGKEKKGDKYYDSFSYKESINKYEAITDKTDTIKRKLAESYYNIGKYEKSELYYAELANSETRIAEDLYNYASVLAVNEKYELSTEWMKKFSDLDKNDSRAKKYLENPKFYTDLLQDKGQFLVKNLDINSNQEDFGAIFYKDKVIFASSRELFRFTRRRWNWNKLPFLDLYIADRDSTYELKNPLGFRASVNKKYHEGPASFNEDGDFMAYTKNNYKEKSKDDAVKLEIYTSEFKNGKWEDGTSVHFNNKEYSVGHAALSPNGEVMYFASDMPGGKGGVDLYIAYRNENKTWGKPINLGDTINTEGNEMFPYYNDAGFLFFASNGHPGLGGLDVFTVNIIDYKVVSEPINLGTPLNTNYDDFALVMDTTQTAGYFSSNRPGGKGDDDIYRFNLLKPFEFKKIILVNVFDNKGNILANTEIKLYDDDKNVIETVKTNDNGKYKFTIEKDMVYLLKGKKDGYSKDQKKADATTNDKSYTVDLILKKTDFSIVCIATDAETKDTIPGVNVVLINKNMDLIESVRTDENGVYSKDLQDIELGDTLNYYANFEKDGYLPKKIDYRICELN